MVYYLGHPLLAPINFIVTWVSIYISYKLCDEITYSFSNFKNTAVEVWEWMSNFIPHFTEYVINYTCWNLS